MRVELKANPDWVAVKVKSGKNTAGVKAEMRNRLAVRNDVDGIENTVAGVVAQQIETRSPKFRTKALVSSDATAVEGVERRLRTFKNGDLAPVVDTGEFCVRFSADVPLEEVKRRLAEVRATIIRPLGSYAPNGYLAVVDKDADAIAAANTLYGKPGVIFSHPNLIRPKKKAYVPNDPFYGQQWHLKNTGSNGTTGGTAGEDINAERAWEITRGSSAVAVAVLDDGFDVGHQDFNSPNKVTGGWDFVSNDADPRPARTGDNHGTSCAGIAVANGNNGKGVSGVAPGCRFMPVRMLGEETDSAEAAAYSHAKNNGAQILSCSYNFTNDGSGFIPLPDVVYAAIDDAASTGRGGKGCVIIFAAGNDTSSSEFSGYNLHPKVIVVGATTNQGVKSDYSNFGPSIDVCAPGGPDAGDMMTVDRTGAAGYSSSSYTSSFNGTSAATPVVAGVAALLLSNEPNLTRLQVRQRLIDSADFIGGVTYDSNGHHDWYGYGRVNAWKALTWNDTTAPTATIRVPGNNLTTTTLAAADGTASDIGTGVYQVRIALRDSLNRWWNWNTPGWSEPNAYVGDLDNHLRLATLNGGTWSILLPDLSNGSYRLHATTIDNADQESTTAVSDFNIDEDGPRLAFWSPVNNSNHATPPSVGGSAGDFIQDRRYVLFREADGLWYDFVAQDFTSAVFNGTTHVDIVPSGSGFWDYAMPATLAPGRYQVLALATDTSGRFSDWDRLNFRVAYPPQVTVTTPQHGTGIQDLESIGGTVNDTSGEGLQNNRVGFTLYNEGLYWTGSSWSPGQTTLFAPVIGGSWNYTSVPTGSNEKSGVYYISAFATDLTGAVSVPISGVNQTTFRIDRDPPSVAVTGPATGSTLTSSTYQFRGTASDVGGIQAVNAFIRRSSDQAYWDGSGWGSSPIVLESDYNSNTGEWSVNSGLPILRGSGDTQLSNGSYVFIAIAIDHAGNHLQADSTVTVDYHQIFNWTAGSYSDLDPGNNNLNWGNPANWSPNGVPSTEDIVYLGIDHTVGSSVSRTVYGFNMSTGALDFDNNSDALTIRKNGSWTGGTLNDAVYIESAATFAMSGSGVKQIGGGGVIHNSGAVTWTGPGLFRGYSNSIWNNKPGSSFTMLTDGDVLSNYSSGNIFNNEANASFVKSGGSGETYIDEWTINNNGSIVCQQGTLHFNTGLNLNSGSSFAGAGRILLNHNVYLTTALTSTGNPELVGTLHATAGSFSGTNPFIWSRGDINGDFSLLAGSVLELASGDTKVIGGSAVFNNLGRVNWNAGLLRGYSNSTFNNEAGGIFDAKTDGDIFSNNSSGNVFNNKADALFIKSGKSAAPDGESFLDEWTFNNWGVIRSDTGTLRFHQPLHLYDGGTITRNGALSAKVRSSYYFVLWGITTVNNITFEAAGDWHGNLDVGTSGNGTLATQSGGVFEWTSGTAHNTVNIAAGSTFSITGAVQKQIGGGGILNCAGNTTWTGTGNLQGISNSTFVNLPGAMFTAANDADWVNNSSGNVFRNRAGAMVNKNAGSENNRSDWAFDNDGTVTASVGAIAMNNGGTSSGTFAPSGAGLVQFTGGNHSLITTAKFQGTGKTQFLGGTADAINPVNIGSTATTLEIAGGTVSSSPTGSFNAIGTVNWTSGSIGGTFNLTVGSSMSLTSAAVKRIDGAGVINNHGTVTWTGTGTLQGYSNSTWNNKTGSSFSMLTDGDVFSNYSSGNVFNNEANASFVKSGGTGECYIDEWTFNNNGPIQSQQGTIHFNTGLNLNAGSSFAGAGRILLNGTTNLAAALTSTGNPELVGTLNATAASFSGTKPFVWSSGLIGGDFSLLAGSVLDLMTVNTKVIGGGSTINNHGRINWKAGLLQGYSNSTLNNESGGVFDATTDGDTFSNYSSGNVFNNKAGATFVKSAGAGECYIDEWTFNNNSTIQSQQGTIHFNTGLNLNTGSTFVGAGRILLNGTTNLATALTSTSNQELVGTLNATAASFAGTNPLIWNSGSINGNLTIDAAGVLDLTTASTKVIGGGSTINNLGRINWKAGLLQGYSNSTLNNESGGIFDATTDGDIFSNYSGGNVFHNNAGALFIKSGKSAAPAGESYVDEWVFNNLGVIRADSGTLRFHTPLHLLGGGSIVRSGALAAKVRSSYYFVLWGTTTVNNVTFEAAGDWHGNLDPGTAGNGTIATQSDGVFEWTAGTAHNTVNIAGGSTFAITGAVQKQIGGGGILNNGGTATWSGTGDLRGYSNSSFNNLAGAVFNVATSAPFTNYSGGNRLTNSGVLNIGTGALVSPLHWSFTQTAGGRLNLEVGGANPATPQFDQFHISGDAALAGTLGVSLINGYAPPAGTAFPVLTFGSRSGSFASVASPGLIWGQQYNPNNLTLVAKTYPTTAAEWASCFFADPADLDARLSADPDKDGLINLLEYALGGDPHAGGATGITAGKVVIGSDTYLTLIFTRPAGTAALTDVAYTGERSTVLGGWSTEGVVVHSVVAGPGEARETVTLRSAQPISNAAKDFLRLKATVGN